MKRIRLSLTPFDADELNDVLYNIKNERIQQIRLRLVKASTRHQIESIRCENCGKKTRIFYTENIRGRKMDCCIPCSNKLEGLK